MRKEEVIFAVNISKNNIVDHFKKFDARRLENFKDATMKYFVYEISYFRNIQYDVNKLIQVCWLGIFLRLTQI